MKKLALLLTLCLLAWTMAGCQTQEMPLTQESSGSEASASSTGQEGDPVVICVEESFEQDAYELENYLKATGMETECEFLVLPDNTEDRETELTRLRTEIMAGEGPDAFVLSSSHPRLFLDQQTMDPLEPLFPNVEKSMYSHLFLDLEDMVQNSEIIDLESCNQVVMDVGVTGDGRFLLPVAYDLPTVIVDRSALENPDYTFSSLDELLQSNEESLKGFFGARTLFLFPDCLGVPADYEGQNLLVTSESLTKAIQQADALTAFRDGQNSGSEAVLGGAGGTNTWMSLQNNELEYAVFPVPNQEGGVTAGVTRYAAVNRNTEHPQEAFAFIEQLFREELVTGGSLEANGHNYYPLDFSYDLPVKEQVLLKYMEPNTQEATMSSLRAAVGRVDSAKVYSDLDMDIYQLYYTYYLERPEETLEELVERTISSMGMTLAE